MVEIRELLSGVRTLLQMLALYCYNDLEFKTRPVDPSHIDGGCEPIVGTFSESAKSYVLMFSIFKPISPA